MGPGSRHFEAATECSARQAVGCDVYSKAARGLPSSVRNGINLWRRTFHPLRGWQRSDLDSINILPLRGFKKFSRASLDEEPRPPQVPFLITPPANTRAQTTPSLFQLLPHPTAQLYSQPQSNKSASRQEERADGGKSAGGDSRRRRRSASVPAHQ